MNTTSISMFSVYNNRAAELVGYLWDLSDNGTPANTMFQYSESRTGGQLSFRVQGSGTNYSANLSAARVNTDQRLISNFVDASKNMSEFDNGATGGTDTFSGTVNIDTMTIGANRAGGAYSTYHDGDVQEVILFNTNESANRTDIESDINTYYSIY